MSSCKVGLIVIVTIMVFSQEVENKEITHSDICSDFINYIKKIQKQKKDDDTEQESNEDRQKPDKIKKFEEQLEKYFERRFPWWPKQQVEDLDATEKPKSRTNPLDQLLNSYMEFLTKFLNMF